MPRPPSRYAQTESAVGASNPVTRPTMPPRVTETPSPVTPATEETRDEVKRLVSEINEKFPESVQFREEARFSLDERLALWRAADVLLITAYRDGLNLLPLEYVVTKKKDAVLLPGLCRPPPGLPRFPPSSVNKHFSCQYLKLSIISERMDQCP